MSAPASIKRNQALDFLRGIAILVVVFHHAEKFTIPGIPELKGAVGFAFWRFRLFGASGVDLFFVLSGFLVGGLLIQELARDGKINVPRFLLRRGMKIWPSYYVLIAVLAVTGASGWLDLTSTASTLKSLAIHGLFLQNYLDQTHNTPTWTLAIEEHFYLILPLLILTLHHFHKVRKIGVVAVSAMILCLGFRLLHLKFGHHDNDFMYTHNRFDGLLFGVFLAWAWREFPDRIREITARKWITIPLILILIFPAFVSARKDVFLFTVGFPMLTLGYGLLLMTAVAQGFGKMETTWLGCGIRQVGLWSYNIYLWHFFLPLLLAPVYNPAQLWLSKLVPNPVVTLTIQVILYAALSIFSGWFFTFFVEVPFLRVRDRFFPSRTAAVKA